MCSKWLAEERESEGECEGAQDNAARRILEIPFNIVK